MSHTSNYIRLVEVRRPAFHKKSLRSGNGRLSRELHRTISAEHSAASLHERTTKTIAILSSRIAWPAVGRRTPPPQSFEQMPYSDHSSTTQSIGHGCMLHAYMCGPCAGNYSFSQMRGPNQAIGMSNSRRCSLFSDCVFPPSVPFSPNSQSNPRPNQNEKERIEARAKIERDSEIHLVGNSSSTAHLSSDE